MTTLLSAYVYRKISKEYKKRQNISNTLDNIIEEVSMPMDSLEDGWLLPDGQRMPNMVSSNMDIDNSPVAERRHRRLPHTRSSRERDTYVRCVVAEIKVKLGTPSKRQSNDTIIRRMARNLMEVHGLRPTHQAAVINRIIAMVYIPSDDEIEASNLHNSWEAKFRRWQVGARSDC